MTKMEPNPLNPGQVLSTLREDGSRIWMRPKLSKGRFLRRRQIFGYGLILLFLGLPFVRIGEHPAILLDVAARRFYLFGYTFHPTDSPLLMLLLLSIFLGIFWLTALVGRAWCGWGCPQTVYMELVFRPIERLIEGPVGAQRRIDAMSRPSRRRWGKYAVFGVIAFILGNQFLSYFVGWERLALWMTSSPAQNPGGFSVMAATTALVFFDFAFFREQMCTVVCPYARLQSALLDRHSMIVGYDEVRGESRKRLKARMPGDGSGDCIDCKACVTTCPVGIDIRSGLQLECINCTQCIDACDKVMDKIGKPRGLIRLSSQQTLQTGKASKIARPRIFVYPVLITILLGLMVAFFGSKGTADVTVLRQLNAPFVVLETGEVRNQLRVKLVNRLDTSRRFDLRVLNLPAAAVLAPQFPLPVGANDSATSPIFLTVPAERFDARGRFDAKISISDGAAFEETVSYVLLGPGKDP
ncbi:MAG: cytochrome c oxidase accessory protein CcoG [Myxococcota bacterium]